MVETREDIRRILQQCHSIAVVGMKDSRSAPAFYVPEYLQRQGYRIFPVNPKFERILGERCYRSMLDIEDKIDLVQVFRASHNVMSHAQEALQISPLVFWMQEGIEHPQAAQLLAQAGIMVVQNRCMLRDHSRLIGPCGN